MSLRKTPITKGNWTLTLDGQPVLQGSVHSDFRGNTAIIVGGTPPHKPGANGYVQTAAGARHYAGVYDMKWEERELTPPPGYTAAELERDNPYNQWIAEGEPT